MKTNVQAARAGVVVSATSTAPFVQQAVLAFAEVGELEQFLTTWVDQPDRPWRRLLRRLLPAFARPLDRNLARRGLRLLPAPQLVVRLHARWEVLRTLIGKLDRQGLWTDRIWQLGQTRFDRWAAHQLQPGLQAIYAFETGALASFARARELGIHTLYEVNAAEHDAVHQLLAAEYARFPELADRYAQHTRSLQQARTEWRQREWQLADRVILYSNYVRRTYAQAGYAMERVRVVPLAAPVPVPAEQLRWPAVEVPLRLLWVGTFSIRKGAHLLLQVWHQLGLGRHAQLDVYGRCDLPAAVSLALPGVILHGSVPQVELREAYLSADALIFPTLSDSFGMVVTEALAHGCPVLTTDAAGAGELLREGVDGRVIAAGDPSALAELLQWALDQRQLLREWKVQALHGAAQRQWPDYRRDLRTACTPEQSA